MSLPLFFCDPQLDLQALATSLDEFGGWGEKRVSVSLPQDEARHMVVLRLRAGEHVRLSDGQGGAIEAELIVLPSKKQSDCEIVPVRRLPLPYRPDLTLVQGVSKGERMDLLVRQAVELGVRRIIPAMTARCIVSLTEQKRESRAARWRSIAYAAAKQSGQPVVPRIDVPLDLPEAIEQVASADIKIVPWEESDTGSIADCLRRAIRTSSVALFVGPEGGFEESEVDAMRSIGASAVTLGDMILRTETAGVIASALAIYELGGLGNGGGECTAGDGTDDADGTDGTRDLGSATKWGTVDV